MLIRIPYRTSGIPKERNERKAALRRSRSRSGDGDSARSQLIQICRLLRAPYQTLPGHDSLDSIGNRPSISPNSRSLPLQMGSVVVWLDVLRAW